VRLEISLSAGDWQRQAHPGFWRASLPLRLPGADNARSRGFRLVSGSREFSALPYQTVKMSDGEAERFPRHAFRVGMDALLIRLARSERPAEETTLSFILRDGILRDGVLRDGGSANGRVRGLRFSGRGLQVWPGEALRVSVDVPLGAVLRFATTLDPMLLGPDADRRPTVFRIYQDRELVFEQVENDPLRPSLAWHAVELSRSDGPSELTFEVRGALAATSFLDPVVGPGEVGPRGQRPWDEPRADILVFMADTFRADNLSAYGGTLALTPNLDHCAQASVLFRRAWSVGTYTLPAHVSMFTGVMPYQAGLRTIAHALPEEMETIAELLSAQGYRTGAITDSGIVSRRFGFDQGFAYFHEDATTLEDTVERALAFLDADDGRPVFLFVHTYRTHVPYRVSEATRRSFGEALGITGEFAAIERGLLDLARERGHEAVDLEGLSLDLIRSQEASSAIEELRAHYLGGVADLDQGFGDLQRALEERRWFEHGWLVFTSDHGEAFGEHAEITHGKTAFEEQARIPLLIRGGGLAPRVVDLSASLVDLAPTLAEMAGLARHPAWVGASLLSLERDRPVLSFGGPSRSTFAVIEGARKVFGYEVDGAVDRERILGAFDLARDPAERVDAAANGEAWPAEMLRRFGPEVERALVPMVESRPARLSPEDLEELRKRYGAE
jgi:arylsulfatase A-like enzyme